MPFEKELEELKRSREKALQMGGPDKVAKKHARGSLTARERIAQLLDGSPYGPAGIHGLHDVIDPRDTRKHIIQTLEIYQDNGTGAIGEHKLANWPTKF
jgi:acetyl-CoA carboxylase carboxyltransferase component